MKTLTSSGKIVCFVALMFVVLISSSLVAGSWTDTAPSPAPTTRTFHAMSYIDNNKVLLFGGYDGGSTQTSLLNDTWLYNANTNAWTNLTLGTLLSRPGPRARAAMASVGNNKVILYGGEPVITNPPEYAQNPAIETWLFNGATNRWTKLTPTGQPPALAGHSMCFIGGTDKVLLFGGAIMKTGGKQRNNQTWIFDLSDNTWTKSTATGPSARASACLVSMGGDKAILFGGFDGSTQLNDTWRFDRSANKWKLREPAVAPAARYNHSGGYVQDGKIAIFGGRADVQPDPNSNSEVAIYGDTWVYDNAADSWTEDTSAPAPAARGNARMAETNLNSAKPIVLFGGSSDQVAAFGDTWEFVAVLQKNSAPVWESAAQPEAYKLDQNYPNPFNPTTTISYQLPKETYVKLSVYDALGQQITMLIDGQVDAGYHQVIWNAADQPSGTYVYRLEAGDIVQTRRMVLLK